MTQQYVPGDRATTAPRGGAPSTDTAPGAASRPPAVSLATMPLPTGTTTAYGAADTAGTALPVAAYPVSSQAMRDAESTATGLVPVTPPPPATGIVPVVGTPAPWPQSAAPATPTPAPWPQSTVPESRAPWPQGGPALEHTLPVEPIDATPWPAPPTAADTTAPATSWFDAPRDAAASPEPEPPVEASTNTVAFYPDAQPWPSSPGPAVPSAAMTSDAPRSRRREHVGATVTHIGAAASAADRTEPTGPAPRLWGGRRNRSSNVAPSIESVPGDLLPEHHDAPGLAPAVEAPAFGAPDAAAAPTLMPVPAYTGPWTGETPAADAAQPTTEAPRAPLTPPDPWVAPDAAAATTAPSTPTAPGADAPASPAATIPTDPTDVAPTPSTGAPTMFARLVRSTGAAHPLAVGHDRMVLVSLVALGFLAVAGIAATVVSTALSAAGPMTYLTATWMLGFLVGIIALVTSGLGLMAFLRTERTNLLGFGVFAIGGFLALTQIVTLVVSMVQSLFTL